MYLTYAIYLIAVLFLQSVLFSRFDIAGVKGLILPAAPVAVGMYAGGIGGAVFGLIFGLFADMSFAGNTVMFTVLFSLIGFAAGFAADFFINKNFVTYAFMMFAALLITSLVQMFSVVFSGSAFFPSLLTALLQTLWSIPPAALLYIPFKEKIKQKLS